MKPHEQPMCSSCGRQHRVSAYPQAWSPYHNACASCATVLKGMLQWAEAPASPPLEQLLRRFRDLKQIRSDRDAKLAEGL